MKRLLSFFIATIMSVSTALAAIEVQPTMMSKSNEQDRVWVATFQLVWNDFMDKVVFNPIRFREGTPSSVQELNRQEIKAEDLSEKCYYKMAGKVTKKTKKQISKAIKKKLGETSDLLDKLDLFPRNDMLIIYAMLKKDFEFTRKFDKLGKSYFGENQEAEYFGISPESNKLLGNGVKVLFYNSSNDYAVKLVTKDKDEVFLYRNDSNKPFKLLYADMLKKNMLYQDAKDFSNVDELKVPNLSFFEEKSLDELRGKRIMGTNYVINQALETIKFSMDNKGVDLKSEAAMTIMTMSAQPDISPRLFYFDDTFVVFLKEKDKKNPYFALRVHDISNYQK